MPGKAGDLKQTSQLSGGGQQPGRGDMNVVAATWFALSGLKEKKFLAD